MSRGPGRVQRSILDLMKSEPDGAWTVEELCERIYEGVIRVEKKHRVAVLRAMKKTVEGDPNWCVDNSWATGGTLNLFNHASITSYALGQLKMDNIESYRDKRWKRFVGFHAEEQLREKLHDDQRRKLMTPGGQWYESVEMHIAGRDGDTETYERLKKKKDAAQAHFEMMMRNI